MEKLTYITTSSKEEAKNIARTLVEERLLACANVYNEVTSYYWWQGQLEEDTESTIIAKTTDSLMNLVVKRVKQLHSSDCPCVVFAPIVGGNEDFLDWINKETKKPVDS